MTMAVPRSAYLVTFLVVEGFLSSARAADTSCRFLGANFPAVAAAAKAGPPWSKEKIMHFISDQGSSFSRLLLNGEEIVCVDFHSLPPAKQLKDMRLELWQNEVAAESVWDRFLAALQELSCQVIQSQGRVGACPETLAANFVEAAREAALKASIYDPSYRRIPRTGGDVPADRGVCSDVIIRALRDFGIDLQQLVWEDIRKNPQDYKMQETWGRSAADPSIDHRRVRNLLVYFGRHPERFAVLNDPDRNWQPGDIVVWNLTPSPKLRHHIGIVSDKRGESGDWMVIHHLPPSGSEDDRLHHWEILAHIRPLL